MTPMPPRAYQTQPCHFACNSKDETRSERTMCESNSSNVTGLRSDCIVAASSGNISAAVEGDLSSLHEGRRDHRSHRLGVGTDVEAVRERHRDVSAGPPRSDCTGCND